MKNEIELKLAVDRHFADFLAQDISNFRVSAQRIVFLGNCYYDTADGYFAKHKMGLRVREEEGQFTLTLKTDGKVNGGLHIRPEYNVALTSAQPDLSQLKRFDDIVLPDDLRLQPVFSTDFERQLWVVECGNGAEIEIALDQGEIRANERIEPICEVEFELKNGQLEDLLTFVSALSLTDGVRLSSLSKAKRGYRLAQSSALQVKDWLEKWRGILFLEQDSAEKSQEKLTALFRYEQQLIEETLALPEAYFSGDFLTTVARISAFFNLYHYYVDDSELLNQVLNEQIRHGNTQSDEQLITDLAESNGYLFEQIRELIRLHSETKNNLSVMVKLKELLQQAQYVKRMLNLIRLTVKQDG